MRHLLQSRGLSQDTNYSHEKQEATQICGERIASRRPSPCAPSKSQLSFRFSEMYIYLRFFNVVLAEVASSKSSSFALSTCSLKSLSYMSRSSTPEATVSSTSTTLPAVGEIGVDLRMPD
mmetsp:Transcript_58595/g.127259  ORF Transcript_58595/g.127259 Transcript_58595/m.127259 type:complete len:120 (+) Transcript_58595:158-517(+)